MTIPTIPNTNTTVQFPHNIYAEMMPNPVAMKFVLTKKHLLVIEFIKPEIFAKYKETGLNKGFRFVESGPLIRSSYHAERHLF